MIEVSVVSKTSTSIHCIAPVANTSTYSSFDICAMLWLSNILYHVIDWISWEKDKLHILSLYLMISLSDIGIYNYKFTAAVAEGESKH